MALTKEWLQEEAGTKVYFRGVDIYRSQPIKVYKDGNHYETTIWGTYKYKITIDIGDWEPECSCTCPYDYGYICKHIVALGLSILDDKIYEGKMNDFIEIEDAEIEDGVQEEFYRTVFLKAAQEQQNAFIKQLFTKNEVIRQQFRHFVQLDKQSFQTNDILQIRNSVNGKLDSLEIDIPSHDYYDDEGDGIRGLGLNEIESILTPYFANAQSKFQAGNLRAGMAILAGVYEGCHNLEEPYLEELGVEWEVVGDYDEDVLEVFREKLEELSRTLEHVIITDSNVTGAIHQLFERINYYTESPESMTYPMVYNLQDWEALLFKLINSEKAARYLLELLESEEMLEDQSVAKIVLKIAEQTDDQKLWIKSAEANASYDAKIALQLLTHYDENGDTASFYRVARNVYEHHQYALSGYLADKISPKENRTFYVHVLSNHSKHYLSIEHYKKVRESMTDIEKNTFFHQVKSGWNVAFYIKVLEVEQDFETLLKLAKQNINRIEYLMFLRPIVEAYPEACWNMTSERIDSLLRAGNRGREWYQSFAEELKLIGAIGTEFAQRVKALVSVLLSEYPRLRAMKEEFVKARLT